MTARRFAVVATVLAIAGAACDWNDRDSVAPPQGVDSIRAAPQPAGQPDQPDAWVTTQVQSRFFTDSALRGSAVDVSTQGGVVTLSGTAPNEAVRAQAVALARQVDGVTRVEDQLEVNASPSGSRAPGDGDKTTPAAQPRTSTAGRDTPTAGEQFDAAWTTTKIQAQYFADPEVKGRNIDVTTQTDGTVTLRGRVESEAARKEALRIAKETEGVRQVVDELRIEADTAPPAQTTRQASDAVEDGWITAKIQSKYFLDPEVKARNIDVDTRNGTVTLSGQVATPAEHRQAVDIARNTDGVREVTDQLKVGSAKPGEILAPAMSDSRSVAPPDGWITTKVQSKLYLSEEVRDEDIKVATARGVVTLQGQVDTNEAKKAAESIARGTKGVRRVDNQLAVSAGTA